MPDIVPVAPKINVAAGKGHVLLQCRLSRQIMFCPIINCLTADQDVGKADRIPNLKNFRELLKGKTVAHRSGPFCHRRDHLGKVGDPPFRPVAHEGHLTLTRSSRAGTALPHDEAAALGFLRFDFAVERNFHNENTLFRFQP